MNETERIERLLNVMLRMSDAITDWEAEGGRLSEEMDIIWGDMTEEIEIAKEEGYLGGPQPVISE
jgi:hypothetical protein